MISVRKKAFEGLDASSTNETNVMASVDGISVISSSLAWKLASRSFKNAGDDCNVFASVDARIEEIRPSISGMRNRFVNPDCVRTVRRRRFAWGCSRMVDIVCGARRSGSRMRVEIL